MTEFVPRRLLPAAATMAALLLLTGLVWWRVLTRDGGKTPGAPCPVPTPIFTSTLPDPSTVTIRVLNSTNRVGLATETRLALENDGFLSPRPAADDPAKKAVAGVAELRFGPAGQRGAALLRYYLPGATLVHEKTDSATIVVSLGRRFRRLPSATAVAQTLSKAKIGLVRPAHPSPSGALSSPSSPSPSTPSGGSSPAALSPSNVVVAPISPTAPAHC